MPSGADIGPGRGGPLRSGHREDPQPPERRPRGSQDAAGHLAGAREEDREDRPPARRRGEVGRRPGLRWEDPHADGLLARDQPARDLREAPLVGAFGPGLPPERRRPELHDGAAERPVGGAHLDPYAGRAAGRSRRHEPEVPRPDRDARQDGREDPATPDAASLVGLRHPPAGEDVHGPSEVQGHHEPPLPVGRTGGDEASLLPDPDRRVRQGATVLGENDSAHRRPRCLAGSPARDGDAEREDEDCQRRRQPGVHGFLAAAPAPRPIQRPAGEPVRPSRFASRRAPDPCAQSGSPTAPAAAGTFSLAKSCSPVILTPSPETRGFKAHIPRSTMLPRASARARQ